MGNICPFISKADDKKGCMGTDCMFYLHGNTNTQCRISEMCDDVDVLYTKVSSMEDDVRKIKRATT